MFRMLNKNKSLNEKGFTLVELLIVVIILAALAAIVIPQFGSSTEDANVSTLKSNLSTMRGAVEVYYQQHNSRYPGKYMETDGTTVSANVTDAATAFVAQLTLYSDKNGKTAGVKDTTFKYGPYLKSDTLPVNPFEDDATATDVLCDIAVNDLEVAVTASGATGWKFYVLTGKVVANDGITLSDNTTETISF